MTSIDETEQILKDARELLALYEKYPDHATLSPNVIVEGGIAWLNEGLCSHYTSSEEERVVRAVVVQALAAMMMDGYRVVREEDKNEVSGRGAREEAAEGT